MYRTALARAHRPRRFAELVGQDHVGSTLRSAVEAGREAHAYLFAGPRGVGKTTAARILAMALNCPDREDGEPCGTCESCERIWSGRTSLDVVEIDAASNRGVDDARDLRERAMYAPTSEDRYKVYIVDEAHMLTRDAWNALLKILEEPPPRVIFAFATTEPQKIEQSAAPVMSRCQRFDFRRVSVADIGARLEIVLEREGVPAEPGAVRAIARRADGGVRDALSLLDQVLSFRADGLGVEDVRRMLGLVEEERYLRLFEIAAARDRARVFSFVQELLDDGHDPAEFTRGLGDALRTLLALRLDPGTEAVDLAPESRDRFAAAAQPFSPGDLVRQLAVVSEFEASGALHRSAQQRIQLEVLLLRLVGMDATVDIEEVLEALGRGGDPARGGVPPDRPSHGSGGSGPAASPKDAGGVGGGGDGGGARSADGGEGRGDGARTSAAGRAPASGASSAAQAGPREGDGSDADPLARSWAAAVAETNGLGGSAVALRGARVEGLEEGRLLLRVPAGLRPDLEELFADRKRSEALVGNLAKRLGLESLRVTVADEGGGRMTARDASRQRLNQWMARDPRLKEAVEELDLTLKE